MLQVVYVTRNPRDTCVSLFHFMRLAEGYSGTLEQFTECFLNDLAYYYTPFIPHVLQYWQRRHLPNVLFITYEEMKKDLASVVIKVATFLGKPLPPGGQKGMDEFLDHLSFKKMRDNAAVNKSEFIEVIELIEGGIFGCYIIFP